MKKNRRTYLLLATVLAIWGILGFKLVNTIGPDPIAPRSENTLGKFVPPPSKMRDTFSIMADYRDPFLGTLPKRDRPIISKTKISKTPPLPEKKIEYTGFVTESTSGKKVFFLSIEGQRSMMSINDVRNGVKLLSGNKNKIKVRYRGRSRTVSIAE